MAFKLFKLSKILIAKLDPSIGSVPEPNSSNKIKLFSVASFKIVAILVIWEENVLRESAMLCSSPISAKTLSKIKTDEPSFAGIWRPDKAIIVRRPAVFNVTVFPPVLGPVMIKLVYFSPIIILFFTAIFLSIRGCHAFFKSNILLELIMGSTPSIEFEYLALANIKSIKPIKFVLFSK